MPHASATVAPALLRGMPSRPRGSECDGRSLSRRWACTHARRMAIARRGSTEQRRVFDPIGSERPSRKSTKRRSTSAHGWPPVCSRRCRRYLRRRPRCRSRSRRRCATHADASSPAGPTDELACHRAARFATQTGTSRAESSSMISPRTRSHTLAQASKPASKVASSIDAALNPDGERRAFNACSDDGFGSRQATMDAAMRARSG